MKKYQYAGPEKILKSVEHFPKGKIVRSYQDVIDWVNSTKQELDYDRCVIATFVIDEDALLRIADRHSEHVACAGQLKVYSAGEITFEISEDKVSVPSVTNQSTGYCPEPDSWAEVEKALNDAGIEHPKQFTDEFIFRRCKKCGSINIVKDNWFVCVECDTELEKECNFS